MTCSSDFAAFCVVLIAVSNLSLTSGLRAAPHSLARVNKRLSKSAAKASAVEDSDMTIDDLKDMYEDHVMNTYSRFSLAMERGDGVRLYDINGKEYLDFAAGISTCCLGHSNPGLATAVHDQMLKVHHVSNLYYIKEQARLARWLTETSCAEKAFFCNSGAEANEGAIKLCRRHAVKRGIEEPVIITAKQSFHGRTLATITATGQPKYQENFGPLVSGFRYVTYNDANELETMVRELREARAAGSKEGLAAIMLEPLQGEGGIRPIDDDFFALARKLVDEEDALLVCDEVQTGMGRTGKLWGHMWTSVQPDIFTSAKALGGGVPIGAMLARGKAVDVLGPGDHASTFGGNPLACAAALYVADAVSSNDWALLDNVSECGAALRKGLSEIAERRPGVVKDIRGWGLIDGVELADEDSVPIAAKVVGKAIERGLLLVPAGVRVVRFVPPLITTVDDITLALERFDAALGEALDEM